MADVVPMLTYRISVDSVPEGIELCKDHVRHLLEDARTLVEKNSWSRNHAVALVVLAIEELGKAKVLRDRLQQTKKEGGNTVEVKESLFREHKPKFNEGCSLIPPEALVIEEGHFDEKYFDSSYFATRDTEVKHTIRLDATFVDWDDAKKSWKRGVTANRNRITDLIIEIENALNHIQP